MLVKTKDILAEHVSSPAQTLMKQIQDKTKSQMPHE